MAAALADLASAEAKLGRSPEAEGHFAEALAIQRRVLPESNPDLAVAQFTFATFLRKQGKIADAEPV